MLRLIMYLQEYFSLNGLQQSPSSLTLDLQSARTTGKYTVQLQPGANLSSAYSSAKLLNSLNLL